MGFHSPMFPLICLLEATRKQLDALQKQQVWHNVWCDQSLKKKCNPMCWCGDLSRVGDFAKYLESRRLCQLHAQGGGLGLPRSKLYGLFVNFLHLDLARRECPMKTFRGPRKQNSEGYVKTSCLEVLQICFASFNLASGESLFLQQVMFYFEWPLRCHFNFSALWISFKGC